MFQRILLIDAESVRVGDGKILRNAGTQFARFGARRIRLERHGVKGAQADADLDLVAVGADAFDDLAQNARAIFERSAEFPGPREGAEKFVQQIAVAMLDIDKVRANVPRDPGRLDIVADQFADFRVGEDLRVACRPGIFCQGSDGGRPRAIRGACRWAGKNVPNASIETQRPDRPPCRGVRDGL